jgi:pyruvate kinase
MVARGDLGIDIPLEDVPLAQDRLIRRARESQIPVIVATQMLETMMHEPRPTRAEISDVFLAGRFASDGVMLSGETAVGKFPAETVDQMRRAVNNGTVSFHELLNRINEQHHGNRDLVPGDYGIGRWVATAALDPSIVGIVVCTTTGKSARLVSSHRPKLPIFAITTSTFTAEGLNLLWGVTPIQVPEVATSTEEVRLAVEAVRPYLEARIPQQPIHAPAVLVVSGRTPGVPGSTSLMQKVNL